MNERPNDDYLRFTKNIDIELCIVQISSIMNLQDMATSSIYAHTSGLAGLAVYWGFTITKTMKWRLEPTTLDRNILIYLEIE